MKTKTCFKCLSTFIMLLLFVVNSFSQVIPPPAPPVPTITGPLDALLMPVTLSGGVTTGQVYTTEPSMINYVWAVSPAGTITAGGTAVDNTVTVTWTNPAGQQSVSVSYTDPVTGLTALSATVLIINYFPFAASINPKIIPQFVEPLPHFAAGLRVNAKAGGNMTIQAVPVKQVALSRGTVTPNGTIGDPLTPLAGLGNYAAYQITYNGVVGPAMWPAQTIEAQTGNQLTVQYMNKLNGITYNDFNILADQTLMMNGYPKTGNILTDPYTGPIPMVVHLHGGEMPSNSDGGPTAWFMPDYSLLGPGFKFNASSLSTYPNQQEATTLWYHPHDQGLTRINVYTGLAGFYFIRGAAEELAQLPGWSGDDKVQEVPVDPLIPTFNGTNAYLPEIELGIQDRMFNVNGELYWPVAPTNPDIHPFWTPEFFGDVMVVNGKTWPYLSVAPRKYRFRFLEGCNARFLDMWLANSATGAPGPVITVIGSDGGMLDKPVILDPAATVPQTLLMAPGERFDVVIDFTNLAGSEFTLMNKANAPYPTGLPVTSGTTDRIMKFVVNGLLVSSTGGKPADKSLLPANLRTANPMVKLTDFAGNLAPGVTPVVKRQIILNEVTGAGGPVQVLFNNSHFDGSSPIPGAPPEFGGPTEMPLEGTTEQISVINTTVDAHPIHIHLLQWQLVSRQAFDAVGYMGAYSNAWATNGRNLPIWPAGLGYPGGSGSPLPYNTPNADGAVGGNPALTPFLLGPVIPANPEEMVWKDDIKSIPGQVVTYIVRAAPTDRPIAATPAQLLFPFDPSVGPGYVWHCHIVDHEDMDMMRPLLIQPSALRFPQITVQPAPVMACLGTPAFFTASATSIAPTTHTYQWQVSTDAGVTFTNLVDGAPYTGVLTNSLKIDPPAFALTNNLYRVVITNVDGVTTSNAALLTVNPLPIPTLAGNNPVCAGSITNVYSTELGMSSYLWVVSAGGTITAGGASTDNTVTVTWNTAGAQTVSVNYTDANGCKAAVPTVFNVTVNSLPTPTFTVKPGVTICANINVTYTTQAGQSNYDWTFTGVLGTDYSIVSGGTATSNTVTLKWLTGGDKTVGVNYTDANGCKGAAAVSSTTNVIVIKQPDNFTTFTSKVCEGASNVIYEVPNVPGVKYLWSYTGTGATITGGTSNSVSVSFSDLATSGYIRVKASNICGISIFRSLYVTVLSEEPAQPGNFTKSTSVVCPGKSNVVYMVPYVSGVVYEWAYSGTGATINATKNYAYVSFSSAATPGTLSVTATNSCGTSIPRTADITMNSPAVQPGNFTTFTNNVCKGSSNVVYEVPNVPGVQYIWSYTGTGATIVGRPSNSVLVSYSATATSGYMTVKAYNGCGSYSPMRTLLISVKDCSLKSGSLLGNGEKVTIDASIAKNELKVYPNPSSGVVYFDFQINENAKVTLDLSSMTGQQIAKIFDADVEAGITQTVIFDQSLAPGVYLYVMRWNNQVITGKLIITQ